MSTNGPAPDPVGRVHCPSPEVRALGRPLARARVARSWLTLVACAALGCGPGGSAERRLAPPLPENLADLDPRVAERIARARAGIESDPDDAQAWGELGMVYGAERLRNLALVCFQEAALRDARQPRWPYREACTLAAMGRVAEAVGAIERSLALEPTYAPSHWRLGTYRLQLGDLDAAERAYQRAAELDTGFPGGWLGRARVHLQRDENDQALAILEELRAREPKDPIVLHLLAEAYRQVGRPSDIDDATVVEEESAPVWNDPWELEARSHREPPDMLRVGLLLREGQAEEALRLLREMRNEGADPRELTLRLAETHLQLGRFESAEREIRELLEDEPENSHAHMLLARILERSGDFDGALAELERVTALQPGNAAALAAKGMALYGREDYPAAAAALRRALELGVGDTELRFTLGEAQLALRSWEEARATFEAVLAEAPAHGDAWMGLARARLKLGDLDGASQAIERAQQAGVSQRSLLKSVREIIENVRARRARKAAQMEGAAGEEEEEEE